MPVEQALQIASQQIDAGQLQAAEAILRQILDKSPTHAEALRLMGILAHQAGNSELAGELIGTAFVTFAEGGALAYSAHSRTAVGSNFGCSAPAELSGPVLFLQGREV